MNRERHTHTLCVRERNGIRDRERERKRKGVFWGGMSESEFYQVPSRSCSRFTGIQILLIFLLPQLSSFLVWSAGCFSCWSVSHCKYHTTQSLELLSLLSTFISLQSLNFKYHLVIPKFIDPAWPFPFKSHRLLDTSTECLIGIQHVTYPKLSVSDLRLQTYPPSVFSCLSNGKSPPQFSYSSPNVHHLFTSNFLPLPYSPDPSLLIFS